MLTKNRDEHLLQKKTLTATKGKANNGYSLASSTETFIQNTERIHHQHTENDIYIKKSVPEKPTIAFRIKKYIRKYIVRTHVRKANE